MQFQHPAQISFWAGLMTEAVGGIVDKNKSGRAAIQKGNDQSILHILGPIFAESLVMKKVPTMQIASYMAVAVFVSKGDLEDIAVTAFMEQIVYGWTNDTIRAALVSLAILAQQRSAKQMSSKVTKALLKVADVGALLVEIGHQRRVDKLANGLCLALIDRFIKRKDSRRLPIIMAILGGHLLKDKQIAVIFKSLLLTALKLNDDNDEDGALRRDLGSALITLSQLSGDAGDVIQSVIQDVNYDIEALEMKLDLSFRSRVVPDANADETTGGDEVTKQDLNKAILDASSRDGSLSHCVLPQKKEIFDEFSHLFISIVAEQADSPDLIEKFDQSPKLQRKTALKDCTYFSFFIRIWCGPYPALARAAAINMVKSRLKTGEETNFDVQSLIPYTVAALGDPSKRVRQAAADLVTVLSAPYQDGSSKKLSIWGAGALYGKSGDIAALTPDVTAKMLQLQILPSVEECIMDSNYIFSILSLSIEKGKYQTVNSNVDKKDHLSQTGRQSILSFLAGHAIATPFLLVKDRLLKALNEVRGVSNTTRTKVLLPVLKWWAEFSEEEAVQRCAAEKVDKLTLESRFVDIVVPSDQEGLDYLFALLKDPAKKERDNLIHVIVSRIKKMWPSFKDDVKFTVAEQLLDISQNDDSDDFATAEATDFLRSVPLTTEILIFFLQSIQTGTKLVTEPPPNKRRRTSSSDEQRGLITQVSPEISQALRKITFVLQLVENSDPMQHPQLLDNLFAALSELQHFRTVVGSELGYLQNLILRSLLAMMPAYKNDKTLKISSSGGYGDLLVNCIQKSSSPVVQNAALLLIARLATTAPNLVLHSVMPIFTFMGTSVLRQSDDYSAHVVSQTIKEVVPPLIASLRQGKKSPVAGASEILVSFTTAYEHIPSHRRQDLFLALVDTLGPSDFLYALIAMLVDRYGPSDALLRFIIDLLSNYATEVQLQTLVKLLDLVADLFKPKPTISFALLGITEDGDQKDIDQIALRQLTAFPDFLASKKLRALITALADQDDMEASEARGSYASLLENILTLADTVKSKKKLHSCCGNALANLLNLLSIGEFIKAVESLLDRPDLGLRQKVLRALEYRVDNESVGNGTSRTVLLGFLPQLTAAIRESTDIRYKHTAVTCVDKIAEKYGKKDIEAVVAAASTIAGEHCLGQDEKRLRVMALLCLTSLVDVLQDAIIPVLPIAIPQTVKFLRQSVEQAEVEEDLHSACYSFISALAEHLPFVLSNHVDEVLVISSISAEAGLSEEAGESRTSCLRFLAKRLEAKDLFAGIERNWDSATSTGFLVSTTENLHQESSHANITKATNELLDTLGIAIDQHTKSTISKNSTVLTNIILKALDLRRNKHGEANDAVLKEISGVEKGVNEKALKMIYKLNDASFRPIFTQLVEWPGSGLAKADKTGRALRQYSVYGFFDEFFSSLKSIVTNYATYIVDDAVKVLSSVDPKIGEEHQLWARVLSTLNKCFEHDQDDFWQAPSHFGAVAPVLMEQFMHTASVDVLPDLIPAVVGLAAAADSQTHQKELNAALLKHLKSEQTPVRLAAVKCEQALTDRLGEEWLSMLHEMLPRISELQEDDDEEVERETLRWIVKIEGVLGESLDAMLQ